MHRIILIGIIVALLAASALYTMYRRDLGKAVAALEGQSDVVETDFGPIEYAERGEGHPALVIHGSGGGFQQGLLMAEPLADEGFRLIAPSRFGYLRTPASEGMTVERQADAHAALMARLGIENAVIIGGSAGALSAIQLAIRHPQTCEALVLLVPAAYAPDRRPNESGAESALAERFMMMMLRADFLFWAASKVLPDTMTRLILATDPEVVRGATPEEGARARRILHEVLPVSRRARGLLFDSRTAGNPRPMDLGKIECSVIAFSTEDDLYGTAASARYVAANVRHGEAVIYPTGGHLLIGRSREMWGKVVDFVNAEGIMDGHMPQVSEDRLHGL
jgi:2-hydroxy-6-oxonona-2,4-dienedioate hydrolase